MEFYDSPEISDKWGGGEGGEDMLWRNQQRKKKKKRRKNVHVAEQFEISKSKTYLYFLQGLNAWNIESRVSTIFRHVSLFLDKGDAALSGGVYTRTYEIQIHTHVLYQSQEDPVGHTALYFTQT